jgi:ketosteroid isomerase-like protein
MSRPTNVEIVKRVTDAYNRSDVEAFAELTTPDFELFPWISGTIDGRRYRGREGLEEWFVDLAKTWAEIHVVAEEIRDLGDRVLWLGRILGVGRGGGVPVDAPNGVLIDFRDGKISRMRTYPEHVEAVRAAGLVE